MSFLHKHFRRIFRAATAFSILNWLTVLSTLFLGFVLFYIVSVSLYYATHISTFPTDGTFQLLNPLRRIDLGQVPGVDFPFFHGIGVPFLHYPIYKLGGSDLFAAELTKQLTSSLLFLLSALIFFYAIFRSKRKTLIATALFCLSVIHPMSLVFPGNSLLGVRTTMPILAAAALLWSTRRYITIRSKQIIKLNEFVAIILLALSLVCGTEQGIAAIGAYLLLTAIIIIRQTKWTLASVYQIALRTGLVLLISFLLFTVLTLGRPFDALHYALIDIPSDQGWYFGAPPNYYLSLEAITHTIVTPGIVIASLSFIAIAPLLYIAHKKAFISGTQLFVSLFLLLTGLVSFAGSSLGYFYPDAHLRPLARAVMLIACFLFMQAAIRHYARHKKSRNDLILWRLGIGAVIAIMCMNIYFLVDQLQRRDLLYTYGIVKNGETKNDYKILSNKGWKPLYKAFSPYLKPGDRVWSTYTGLYDNSFTHTLNPSPGGEDYIIHALGEKRRQDYVNSFKEYDADYVITVRPQIFIFEEWLWTTTWSFYKYLYEHYEIIQTNDAHVLWKRVPDNKLPLVTTSTPQQLNQNTWKLPDNNTDSIQIHELTVHYKASAGVGVKALDKMPRYLIDTKNTGIMTCAISLPPQYTAWTFPIIVKPHQQDIRIHTSTGGILPSATLTVQSVQATTYTVSPDNSLEFTDNVSERSLKLKENTNCALDTQ